MSYSLHTNADNLCSRASNTHEYTHTHSKPYTPTVNRHTAHAVTMLAMCTPHGRRHKRRGARHVPPYARACSLDSTPLRDKTLFVIVRSQRDRGVGVRECVRESELTATQKMPPNHRPPAATDPQMCEQLARARVCVHAYVYIDMLYMCV